jgi:hypothetical protein
VSPSTTSPSKGKRFYLIVATGLVGVVVMAAAGGKLYDRFAALSGDSATDQSAYGSYEDRKYLMVRALDGIEALSYLWDRCSQLSKPIRSSGTTCT